MSASVVDILHTKKEASLPASIIVEHSAFAARIHPSHSSARLCIHHPTFPSRRLFCARYPQPKLDRSSSHFDGACLSIGRVEVQERLRVASWQVFFLMRVLAGTISASAVHIYLGRKWRVFLRFRVACLMSNFEGGCIHG